MKLLKLREIIIGQTTSIYRYRWGSIVSNGTMLCVWETFPVNQFFRIREPSRRNRSLTNNAVLIFARSFFFFFLFFRGHTRSELEKIVYRIKIEIVSRKMFKLKLILLLFLLQQKLNSSLYLIPLYRIYIKFFFCFI